MGINKSRRSTFRKINGTFAKGNHKIRRSISGLDPLNSRENGKDDTSYDPGEFLSARERRLWDRLSSHRKKHFLREAERALRKHQQKKGIAVSEGSLTGEIRDADPRRKPKDAWHDQEAERKQELLAHQRQKQQHINQMQTASMDQEQQSSDPFFVRERLERRVKQDGILAERAGQETGKNGITKKVRQEAIQTHSGKTIHEGERPYDLSRTITSPSEKTAGTGISGEKEDTGWRSGLSASSGDMGTIDWKALEAGRSTGEGKVFKEAADQAVKEAADSHISLKAAQVTARLFRRAVRQQKSISEQKNKQSKQESLGDFERSARGITFLTAQVVTSVIAVFQTVVTQVASALLAILIPIILCAVLVSFLSSFLSGIVGTMDQTEVQAGTGSNIVAVAIEQIGYQEGPNQDTKYGKFTNTNHMSWCHAFITWCANECGYLDDGIMPKTALCEGGRQWYLSQNEYQPNDKNYVPQPGDIIYFDFHGDGVSHHAGIVEYSENGVVHTIEGNKRNKVMRGKYPVGYAKIMGYGRPAYPEEGYDDYGTSKDYLDKVKEMGDAIVGDKNWIYSNSNVSRTFAGARKGNRRTNCAHAISLTMQEFGSLKRGQTFYTDSSGNIVANNVVKKRIEDYYDIIKVNGVRNAKGVKLQAGDICLWNAHVSVYVGTSGGKKQWYDFSHKSTTNTHGDGGTYVRYDRSGDPGQTLYQILRLKDQDSYGSGKKIKIPSGYGDSYTYMGWSMIQARSTPQYKMRELSGEHYDAHGFAMVNGRNVIACTPTFGKVGDEIDFVLANGKVIHGIMGDEKNMDDPGCNKWGHDGGHTVVEFVVNKDMWYYHLDNTYITKTHPEWKSRVVMAVNTGKNYFHH